MSSHEELVAELAKLEKLSHAARLKHAKKRRQKQLKKYQEWIRNDRQSLGSVVKKRTPPVINFEESAVLNDLVARNDIIGVSKILENGSDPNICNADGLTPLHKCCIDNALDMAEIILDHGVDLNSRDIEGWTPLHAAAATGNIRMINLLIDEGANLVAINNDDKMPIDVAADGDIRYILQQKMIEAGYTEDVLGYIRISVPKTMLADLKDSLKNDRSLNILDRYGTSALHIAAANGYTEVLDFLLGQEEVELDIHDNEGWTPFHAAVCWNQPEAMKKLAEKGANMDLKNTRGETSYAIAEDPEVRQLILELKGQYGQSQEISLEDEMGEERMPRARRMSVKRISQQAKEEIAKQSVQEEVTLRKESMVQHDIERSLGGNLEDKDLINNEIAGMEEDDVGAMVRLKSFSVTKACGEMEEHETSLQDNTNEDEGGGGGEEIEDSLKPLVNHSEEKKTKQRYAKVAEENDRNRKTDHRSRASLQEEPFHKSRVPRKSVLKRTDHPIHRTSSTYASTTTSSPPLSPSPSSDGSEGHTSPAQQDRKCCNVM